MDSFLAQLTSEKNSNLPTVISLLTGFPSFILYTLEAVVIARNWHKFESPFWRLFFVRACIHIFDFFDSVIFFRLGKIPLGYSFFVQLPSVVCGIGYFFWLYLYESQNFISIFLVLTRLTSIIFPMKLRPIWRRLLPLCIFITFIVPLCDTWENLGRKYRIDYEDSNFQFDNTTYVINYDSDYYGNEYNVLNAFYTADNFVAIRSSVILLVVSTLLNIITIFLYSKKQRNGGGSNTTMNDEERSVEKRLLIFTVLNFLCQLLMALWWLLLLLTIFFKFKFTQIMTSACYNRYYLCRLLWNNQYWIKDIDALHSPAWLILWSSKMLRELIYKQIGIGNVVRQQMNSHQTQYQPTNNLQTITPNLTSPKTAWK